MEIKIKIPDKLAAAFEEATTVYNAKNETAYTAKQVLKRLLRNFSKDTLHAARIETANNKFEEEFKDL